MAQGEDTGLCGCVWLSTTLAAYQSSLRVLSRSLYLGLLFLFLTERACREGFNLESSSDPYPRYGREPVLVLGL